MFLGLEDEFKRVWVCDGAQQVGREVLSYLSL